jgi:Na+-driven multidrug efflux pump
VSSCLSSADRLLPLFASLQNWKAVRNVCRTAAPISFGFLLQYGEWEILTVFAAHLGPAEVATWGILGTLWESFEAITEGIADGGEIRVGYHLGANRPKRAMRAAYKAVIFGMFIGCIFTSVIFMLGDNLAVWFTTDPALQHMIADLLPLLGIGNIALTAGIVAWGLVGAQGRYRLATTIAFVSSWLVTMPLAAIFTYVLNFDLKGMTTAVVVGYSLTNTTLLYVLILSDWDRLSKIIIRMHLEAAEQNESSSSSRSCNAHEVDVGEEPSTESPDRSTSNQTYNC